MSGKVVIQILDNGPPSSFEKGKSEGPLSRSKEVLGASCNSELVSRDVRCPWQSSPVRRFFAPIGSSRFPRRLPSFHAVSAAKSGVSGLSPV